MTKYIILQAEENTEMILLDQFLNYLEKRFKVTTRAAIVVETDEAVLDKMLTDMAIDVIEEVKVEGVRLMDIIFFGPADELPVVEGNVFIEKAGVGEEDGRVCAVCGGPIPEGRKKGAVTCSTKCYMRDYNQRNPKKSKANSRAGDGIVQGHLS